jgi:hypothetical protein
MKNTKIIWVLKVCTVRAVIASLLLGIFLQGCNRTLISLSNELKFTKTPVSTQLASPIDRINLEDLMLTIDDLPPSIPWHTTGNLHVIVENAGLKGENAIQAHFSPVSNDFLGPDQMVLRFSSNSLAEVYYNQPIVTEIHGFTPSEWNYHSSVADEARITCDNRFGSNINIPMTCISIARYGQIVVIYQVELFSDVITIETMEKTVETIDEKITRTLGNSEKKH